MLAQAGRPNRPAFTRLALSGVAVAALAATLSVPALADTSAQLQSQPQVQPQVLDRLPALSLQKSAVTVSGISSGAYMASQFAVAYSASVAGAGMVAGGPYGCSNGSVSTAMLTCSCFNPAMMCTTDLQPDALLANSWKTLKDARNDIDDTKNIEKQRVWIYHGLSDKIVNANLTRAVEKFYRANQVPAENIKYVARPVAGHSFASPLSKDQCGLTQFPFMVKCENYSAAEDLLTFLYPQQKDVKSVAAQGKLWQFKQSAYTKGMEFTGMDDTAWMYVPKACEADASKCKLHVAFHGCQQSQSFNNKGNVFGMRFVAGAGYNEWAEAAGVVVLYPQAKPTGGTLDSTFKLMLLDAYKVNPESCWDFWGYTEKNAPIWKKFATRSAPQMKAVKAMIDDLLKPADN